MISTILAIIGLGIVLVLAAILIGVIGVSGFYLIRYGIVLLIIVLVIKLLKKLDKKEE